MKTKLMIYAFFAILALSLSCCSRRSVLVVVDDPENQSDQIRSNKELATPKPNEQIKPERNSEQSLQPQYYPVNKVDTEEIQSKCREIALLCNDLMVNGEKETSIYFLYDTTLTQSAVDEVERLLSENGYSVLDSDSKYPEYLDNADDFRHFLELAYSGENAQQSIVNVSVYNSIYYLTFQYLDNIMYYINTTIAWDEDGEYTISDPYKMETLDWGVTYNEFFYYQMYRVDPHWNACASFRLDPADKKLYDLYADYLAPIGYPSSVFTLDWDNSNYGAVCFNDLFEALYKERYNDHVYPADYEYYPEMQCCLIPADTFENAILPYFDVSLDEFRALTLYKHESNSYPWQTLGATNLIFCPILTPDVVECRENADGTFTIVVEVLCFDYKYFPYFIHEITIKPNSDGGFQYRANKVTYTGDHGVPDTTPRLAAQRK